MKRTDSEKDKLGLANTLRPNVGEEGLFGGNKYAMLCQWMETLSQIPADHFVAFAQFDNDQRALIAKFEDQTFFASLSGATQEKYWDFSKQLDARRKAYQAHLDSLKVNQPAPTRNAPF